MKVALAIALVAMAVVVAGCGRADYSSEISFAEVTSVIDDAGLQVCRTETSAPPPPGAAEERAYEVDADCAEEARALVVQGMLAAAGRILGDVPAAVDAAVRPRWG